MDEAVLPISVVDEATGPLVQIEKAAEKLGRQARSTQKAMKAMAPPPTPAAAMTGPTETERAQARYAASPQGKQDEAESALRAEIKARRLRTRSLRVEEQQGNVTGAVASKLQAVMGSGEGAMATAFGKMGAMAGAAEGIGYQMSAFGGTMGSTGEKLVKIGGVAGGFVAAATAGYAVGQAIDEWSGQLSHWAGFSGRSISSMIAGERSTHEVAEQNEKYAHSLGYASSALHMSSLAIGGKMASDRELQKRTNDYSRMLTAVPVDKTGVAMAEFERNLMKAALQIVKPGEDLALVVQKLQDVAGRNANTWAEEGNRHAELGAAIKTGAQKLQMFALSTDASVEDQKTHNQVLASYVSTLESTHQIRQDEQEAVLSGIQAEMEKRGSIGTVIKAYEKTAQEAADLNVAFKQLKLPTLRAANQMELMELTAAKIIQAKAQSEGLSPEMTQGLLAKASAKFQTEKSKLHVDFRGSRFDIKQNFATGFDPDLIAVAFTGDLVNLGERRIQSGQAPIFGGR